MGVAEATTGEKATHPADVGTSQSTSANDAGALAQTASGPTEEEAIKLIYPTITDQMQKTRDSMVRILTGYLTISFAMLGLAVTNVHNLSDKRRLLLSVGLVLVSLLFVRVIWTLNRLFNGFAIVITRINHFHGAYTKGRFRLDGDTHLYPEEWRSFGSRDWREPLFHNAYLIIASVCVLGLVVVWVLS